MMKFDFNTEEKVTKTQKYKKITFRFEKKSQKLFTYIVRLIKSLL